MTNSSILMMVFVHLCWFFFSVFGETVCIESERETLLKFKDHLKDPSNRLSSWNATANSNCCNWVGVVCNNITSHVTELHLYTPVPVFDEGLGFAFNEAYGQAKEEFTASQFGGEINPCLVDLKYLNYLDLSQNRFESMSIPSFLGTMTSLTHLNLSNAGFMGDIPPAIGNLYNLLYLDLGSATVGIIPSQIGNLSNLLYLDLSYVVYGTIPSQIGNLSNLVYLDFRNVFIENSDWLSSLSKLEYLDLGCSTFYQSFHSLHTLQALPSLMHLHLSLCTFFQYNQPSFLNFSSLLTLDLSEINYSPSISFVPKWVFGLKKLVSLSLMLNEFEGPVPDGIRNLTLLENLDLSANLFSSIPDWFYGNFQHLTFLNLRNNNLHGTISEALGNVTSLVELDLAFNQLEGPIPKSLGNLCNLRKIDFSYLKLNQHVNEILDILAPCVSHELRTLKVQSSQLSGNLTDQFGVYKNIVTLYFRDNKIGGELPRSLGKLSSLRFLNLWNNQFNGNPFESLRSLSKLSYLDISDNHFQGIVMDNDLTNLTNLIEFRASRNNLTLKVHPSWYPTFQLIRLGMSYWQLGPNFPSWIQSQNKLRYLEMSNTGILGSIPTWFWATFSKVYFLNLSYNHIHGELGSTLTNPISIIVVDLSANNLSGRFPYLSNGVASLDLSSNSLSKSMDDFLCKNQDKPMQLEFLSLASNNLLGEIPDCWGAWPYLVDVNLQSNNFVGNLPTSMGSLVHLQSLRIRNNSLSGTFPTILKKTKKLILLDLGKNNFSGTIPAWFGEHLLDMKVLILRSNRFLGHIPNKICDMSHLQILDLAQNNLTGKIPTCFNSLKAMTQMNKSTTPIIYLNAIKYTSEYSYDSKANVVLWVKGRGDEYKNILGLVTSIDLSNNQLVGDIPRELTDLNGLIFLNFSHNQLVGHIPQSIGNMRSLLTIDFSRNQLSGQIPPTISDLSFLSMLNLSYNHLKGKIPSGTQLQTFDVSNFIGNNLCGPPLHFNCNPTEKIDNFDHNKRRSDRHGVNWFFVSMTIGFVMGFWIVIGPLFICRSWRNTYFHFLDHVWKKLQYIF
ncbi:receptor-like protein EIX2 [Phaseolus vulgaris]|uniref:receptor-like protein EIX2 n=1 Tax=Phaseolus vulgaris TaxID=3885 RepID=UPI0035CA7E0D